MKSREEIEQRLDLIVTDVAKYPAMTYENGAEEALMWVLEEIGDVEFLA